LIEVVVRNGFGFRGIESGRLVEVVGEGFLGGGRVLATRSRNLRAERRRAVRPARSVTSIRMRPVRLNPPP
jgi:hypothetical protein